MIEQKNDTSATVAENKSARASILASVRLSGSFDTSLKTKKKSGGIPVTKPNPGMFFRSLDKERFSFDALSIKEPETDDIYLLSLELAEQLADEPLLRPRRFTVCVTSQDGLVLWPISLPVNGQLDEYNKSALSVVEAARTSWLRVVANRSVGAYEVIIAEGDLPEPELPSMEMDEIVSVAFKDRVISEIGHPVLKRLRGE